MAIYRTVSLNFWTDPKVDDEFSPEDKYFYLFLLTNPHTTISGCYEISMKQMCRETGYNEDTVNRLLNRLEKQHEVIRYSAQFKEVLILNWHKYNWSKSEKVISGVVEQASHVKCPQHRAYLADLIQSYGGNTDTLSIGYQYPMETSVSVSVTDTVSVNKTDTDTVEVNNTIPLVHVSEEEKPKGKKKQETVRHCYGEFRWVKLSDAEYSRLVEQYGEEAVTQAIQYVDEAAQGTHNRAGWSDWNLTVRRCIRDGWMTRNKSGPKYNRTIPKEYHIEEAF